MLNNPKATAVRLFLLGFLTLFLELALIRYLAGNVWNMGFFPNLVLMGVFIGMGIGFVFHQFVDENRSPVFLRLSVFTLLLLVSLVKWKHPAVPGFTNWLGSVGGEVYFTSTPSASAGAGYLPFILIFAVIVLIFFLISQRTAKYFAIFSPLKSYTLDILGSCCGILSFMLISWLQIPAYLWFAFLVLLFWGIEESARWQASAMLLLCVLIVWLSDTQLLADPDYDGPFEAHWSPYQKVEISVQDGQYFFICVNGIGHQGMLSPQALPGSLYMIPYRYRTDQRKAGLENVMVIGAGSGNDVAAALLNHARHVDAIEIDPVIAGLGRRLHPLHPYQDPRVNQVVDDARAFLTYTRRKYDVIIFALTDSLVKVSPVAQLRLENYIFTEESVRRACSLLKPGGTIFFYNYYRLPWVKEKIQEMASKAAGFWPQTIYQSRDFAMLVLDSQHPAARPLDPESGLEIPHDDWPFLYLKTRGIPALYLKAMITVALLVLMIAFALHRSARSVQQDVQGIAIKLAFLFMGTAFLLLETKSVIQFSLLFGTTWLNNSLVFLSVLVFVLAANWTATLVRSRHVVLVSYLLLMGFCLVAMLYPLGNLLAVENVFLRFLCAAFLAFSPIFFANVIFSTTFAGRKVAEHLFGWNLIGAALGGILEYTSMALGYNALALIVAVCYTLVFFLLRTERTGLEEQKATTVNAAL